MVVRSGCEIWRLELSPAATLVLRRLIGGERLGAALSDINASPDQVQGWFQDWMAHGVFERIVVTQN